MPAKKSSSAKLTPASSITPKAPFGPRGQLKAGKMPGYWE